MHHILQKPETFSIWSIVSIALIKPGDKMLINITKEKGLSYIELLKNIDGKKVFLLSTYGLLTYYDRNWSIYNVVDYHFGESVLKTKAIKNFNNFLDEFTWINCKNMTFIIYSYTVIHDLVKEMINEKYDTSNHKGMAEWGCELNKASLEIIKKLKDLAAKNTVIVITKPRELSYGMSTPLKIVPDAPKNFECFCDISAFINRETESYISAFKGFSIKSYDENFLTQLLNYRPIDTAQDLIDIVNHFNTYSEEK